MQHVEKAWGARGSFLERVKVETHGVLASVSVVFLVVGQHVWLWDRLRNTRKKTATAQLENLLTLTASLVRFCSAPRSLS